MINIIKQKKMGFLEFLELEDTEQNDFQWSGHKNLLKMIH